MQVEGRIRTFLADEAIGAKIRVKLSATGVAIAGDEESADGVTQHAVASGEYVAVALTNFGGTFEMTAAGAITAGAAYYGAAAGKIEGSGTEAKGKVIEAAGASGDIIEVLPNEP